MYLWFKALHIIGFVSWFAGLFYIFRLFVYHTENKENSEICALLETMERKLMKFIMLPAMIVTLIMGAAMLFLNPAILKQGWMHSKFLFLALLIAYHHYADITRKRFAKKDFFLNSKQCRIINEVPTIALIAIALLAVLRPF